MPVETRRQLAARYLPVVEAEPQSEGLPEVETRALVVDGLGEEETLMQRSGWWEEDCDGMASGAGLEGRLRFSGKKGEGLTIKQLELMVKASLLSRFKKLQKDVGEPVAGAEFLASYCIFLGEFLDNPAKLAHEREYEYFTGLPPPGVSRWAPTQLLCQRRPRWWPLHQLHQGGPGHATIVVRWSLPEHLPTPPQEQLRGQRTGGGVQEDVEEGGDEPAMCVGRLGTWRPSALGGWSRW
jgi:hypothetical protein